ncbi:6-phosphogluconate dehydrogenase [Xylariaceae sp. FL1272]|nr:6-phosphogluconate dehydrogenase [Xylariaceae sp. FL1272]
MHDCLSVIGAGPAGFALAADLQSQGKSVLVYSHPAHLHHANAVRDKGFLTINGAIESFMNLHITSDMGEAVSFSKVIILTVPSTGQETVLQELKKFDLRRHTIIAIPGNLFSLIASAELEAECFLETNLSPYSCRMDGGSLQVMGTKSRILIAALHTPLTRPFCQSIQSIFPMELVWCSSVIEVCLSNINGVFHPLMMLMNAGRIESTGGDFFLYRDGLTRSVANAMEAVDEVRIKTGAAFGLRLQSALDVSNECYSHDFTDLVELAEKSLPHRSLRAPANIDNRNVSEDVPDLLVCWNSLAEKLGIDGSAIKAVIVLAEMATGKDYLESGRNLKRLKLDGLTRTELLTKFHPYSGQRIESRL